jgi:hypothetical protein
MTLESRDHLAQNIRPLLDNGLGKIIPAATNTYATRRVGRGVFYAVRAETNLKYVLILLRISCLC